MRITLKCVETSNWKMEAICEKQKSFRREIVLKKIVKCSNRNCSKDFWDCLLKVKDKWERFVKRMRLSFKDNFYVGNVGGYTYVNC
jgi:hypothetical protein